MFKIIKIRGRQRFFYIPKETSKELKKKRARELINKILKSDHVSTNSKQQFKSILNEGFLDNYKSESKERKMKALCDSVIERCKNPKNRLYSRIKGKLPYSVILLSTFQKLHRLACYRFIESSGAPLTFRAFLGFSMSCDITFSMSEMYVPDKLKFPCKLIK